LDVGPAVGVQAAKFAEICKVVCADPTVDLVTVQGLMPINPGDPANPELLRSVLDSTDKPVLAFGRIAQNALLFNFVVTQALPRIADLPQANGLFMESLMAAIAQGDEAARERVRAFLDGRASKVRKG